MNQIKTENKIETIWPAKIIEVDRIEEKVTVLLNLNTVEKPLLQSRNFPLQSFADIVKDFSQYPHHQYCLITSTVQPGLSQIKFERVDGTPEFRQNFLNNSL